MMMSEFTERTGFEPTYQEYREIEAEYMGCDVDKDKFCKDWKKNGGIQRLMRLRARRIEELEDEITMKDRQYDEMDARHCRNFNDMNNQHKEKEAKLEAKINEYEEKLNAIRKAFEILGLGMEVA